MKRTSPGEIRTRRPPAGARERCRGGPCRRSLLFFHLRSGRRACRCPHCFKVASASDAAIVCSNSSFARPDDTPVFDDLSSAMPPGRTGPVTPNGAGKTTLLRPITGDLVADSGEIKRNDGRIAYLSQRLDLPDLDRAAAQDLAAHTSCGPAERTNLLARFLFRGDRAHLPAGVPSGAEPAPTCWCSTSRPTTSIRSARAGRRAHSTTPTVRAAHRS
ncbi:hypothetical protein GCM10010129_76950 [Streptomyces fumigatiscleroticus]|nr:hypothetical protein GCM10010129_76950 [Streptomyces fumigatiscleroticus]